MFFKAWLNQFFFEKSLFEPDPAPLRNPTIYEYLTLWKKKRFRVRRNNRRNLHRF
mgnify:CR=1 FL=1